MSTMDFVVSVAQNSGGTITLTSTPFEVREYDIQSARHSAEETDNALELRLTDGSVPNNLDELRTLNKLLRDAYDRNQKKDRRIDPVYLTFQEATGGTVWRSEIVNARADWLPEALEYGYWTGNTQFADLELTRANYWEGPEAQVPLSNPNGTNNLSGLLVCNGNDGSGGTVYNYVDIAGTVISGDMPGNTRLEITNNYVNTVNFAWIGQNWNNTAFNHLLEAEAAAGGGTASASTADSGGSIVTIGIPDDLETEAFNWTLNSAYLTNAGGGYFKAMIRHNTGLPFRDYRFRLKIKYQTGTLWQSDLIGIDRTIGTRIRDLITFQLPPWIPGLSSLAGLNLVLSVYQNTGASQNLAIDCLFLIPVDGWRFARAVTIGILNGDRLVDDGINKRLYIDDTSGGDKVGGIVPNGQAIQLRPGTDQRLYFLYHESTANTAHKAINTSVKLFYRPKRLSL